MKYAKIALSEGPRAGDQREQERRVDGAPPPRALADARDDAVDPLAELHRDLESLVKLTEPLELVVELRRELRESSGSGA
jgi:hypothetical protein